MIASNPMGTRLRVIWPRRPSRLLRVRVLVSATLLLSSQPAPAQFTRQAPKLVGRTDFGTPAVQAYHGQSVALSVDGNTAIVSGFSDNSNTGTAWVFTMKSCSYTASGTEA
jgi:hypothetical protein